ncbi:hypothetical protein BP6252_11583 [Coleophoma cylindrospora]|uniref:Zn(2)-C6 fungal-type domain-containing protein n=1 Tax=Coleophoma cylindrospora TaxID=1849047 RepID=A0A3D8QKF6_9HELO|nr:hypothetical protein BP6252_11583 [Coleophoma cylindrospora]
MNTTSFTSHFSSEHNAMWMDGADFNASFTITQPFLGAPLQFSPALGSKELEFLVDAYVMGAGSHNEKLSEVTIDFYNFATVDILTGALVRRYDVLPIPFATSPSLGMDLDLDLELNFRSDIMFTPSPSSGYDSSFAGFTPPPTTPSSSFTSSAAASTSGTKSQKSKDTHRVTKKSSSAKKESKAAATARLPGFSIMTKDGVDVTTSAGRGTKTKEQREHAHLMRIMKACDACKRKKVKCDPSHPRDAAAESVSSSSSSSSSPSARTPLNGDYILTNSSMARASPVQGQSSSGNSISNTNYRQAVQSKGVNHRPASSGVPSPAVAHVPNIPSPNRHLDSGCVQDSHNSHPQLAVKCNRPAPTARANNAATSFSQSFPFGQADVSGRPSSATGEDRVSTSARVVHLARDQRSGEDIVQASARGARHTRDQRSRDGPSQRGTGLELQGQRIGVRDQGSTRGEALVTHHNVERGSRRSGVTRTERDSVLASPRLVDRRPQGVHPIQAASTNGEQYATPGVLPQYNRVCRRNVDRETLRSTHDPRMQRTGYLPFQAIESQAQQQMLGHLQGFSHTVLQPILARDRQQLGSQGRAIHAELDRALRAIANGETSVNANAREQKRQVDAKKVSQHTRSSSGSNLHTMILESRYSDKNAAQVSPISRSSSSPDSRSSRVSADFLQLLLPQSQLQHFVHTHNLTQLLLIIATAVIAVAFVYLTVRSLSSASFSISATTSSLVFLYCLEHINHASSHSAEGLKISTHFLSEVGNCGRSERKQHVGGLLSLFGDRFGSLLPCTMTSSLALV